MTGDESRSPIDTTVPHSARIWNYWLGGKDNYVPCPRWRPDPGDAVQDMDEYCALGRTSAT